MAFFMKSASGNNNSLATCFYMKAALFHSTPVLERKRRTHSDSSRGASRNSSKRSYNYSRRCRKMRSKHTLLRNVSDFAEHLFQSWQDDNFCREASSSKGSRWFEYEPDWVKGKKKGKSGSQGPQRGSYRKGGGFQFCDESDEDVEVIFRSAFGGDRCSYWSFVNDDSFRWRTSSYTGNHSRNWRSKFEDDYDTYEEYDDNSKTDLTSDRLALGLSASGPLKLEEVKNAYRACALKYHPDRHQGSSKAVAEEKFKLCSAAYQSLCDKMD